jgi:hypothetical protein
MAAVAAANPIPTADLRSILLIVFLPTLHNKPLQKAACTLRDEWRLKAGYF